MIPHGRRASGAPTALQSTWSPLLRRAGRVVLPAVPTLVVAPHPDDEVLMAGGLIAMQRARRVEVQVVAVTDGEAAYAGADPVALASRRRTEQLAALGELGVQPTAVTRLGLPDGAVGDHIDEIVDAVVSLDHHGLVVAPWVGDHHCDHEATGAAVRRAVQTTGAMLLFGLFWTWHHRTPDALVGERLLELELDDTAMDRRARALRCHRSQFDPEHGAAHLTEPLVEPASWPSEFFVAAVMAA